MSQPELLARVIAVRDDAAIPYMVGETDGNHRVTCIDHMYFDDAGHILPIEITKEGVERRGLE
jgi:hypothetical protein